MNDDTKTEEKLEKPHAFFSEPREVVIDPSLSKDQKIAALDCLEQDARQLLTASDEGMTGGEPNKLHEVLDAKNALDKHPAEYAYDVVLHDLRAKLTAELTVDARATIERAVEALHAVEKLVPGAMMENAPSTAPEGVLKPGSKAEIQDEIEREKMDP